MKAHDEWIVLPHGPIVELAENLWCVRGSLPKMSLRRNMTLARFADGNLLVHSPVALEPAAMQKLDSFGPVRFIAVPSGDHRLDAKVYKRRYPAAQIAAPRGARAHVAEVVPVDLAYDEVRVDDPTMQLLTLGGCAEQEGALVVRSLDGTTVVLNDAIFDMDMPTDLMGRVLATIFGMAPGPRVGRLMKLRRVKDASMLRADLDRFAALPDLARLIVSHDKIERGPEARAALRKAITYL